MSLRAQCDLKYMLAYIYIKKKKLQGFFLKWSEAQNYNGIIYIHISKALDKMSKMSSNEFLPLL